MDMFSALAEPTRRQIFEMLAASGISRKFPVSAPAISQHLKVLRDSYIVTVEKRAQQRFYRINPAKISELEQWARKMHKLWEDRFDRTDGSTTATPADGFVGLKSRKLKIHILKQKKEAVCKVN